MNLTQVHACIEIPIGWLGSKGYCCKWEEFFIKAADYVGDPGSLQYVSVTCSPDGTYV